MILELARKVIPLTLLWLVDVAGGTLDSMGSGFGGIHRDGTHAMV